MRAGPHKPNGMGAAERVSLMAADMTPQTDAPQVNGFKSWLTTNWPALPTATVNRCDTLVGMTRINAAREVVNFIRRRADARV